MSAKARLAALGLTGAISLVAGFEGLRQYAYLDPVGVPTICFGHTGPDVQIGNWKSLPECEDLLAKDLLEANRTVDRCTSALLSKNQRIGMVSFAYSVGPGGKGIKDGYCSLKDGREPTFLRLLNAGNYSAACNALLEWRKAKGIVLPGLVKRRERERQICLTPDNS